MRSRRDLGVISASSRRHLGAIACVVSAVRSRCDLGRISQDEIAEMRRKFKIMTRQIEQLKEEIQQKDQVAQTYRRTY